MFIWAHRGASHAALENSEAALALAVEEGADGVEIDVRRCASGEVVVCHDDTLKRVAQSASPTVEDATFDALRRIVLNDGSRILRLEEVYEIVGPDRRVNVELKLYHRRETGLEQAVVQIVRDLAVGKRTLFSCFHPLPLRRLHARCPEVPRALLFGISQDFPWRHGWHRRGAPIEAIHPQFQTLNERRIAAYDRDRLEVNVWTVDASEQIRRCLALGVDGVITNRPGLARSIANDNLFTNR
ncbi:MAG: glycerophosphodiester phosphodiesterase [Myxococcales bacterium]|nr:glycerophosphodiester phosphodiesterase [Myxococcales bacterium]